VSKVDDVLQAIADPTRRRVLDLLTHGSMAAGEIAACFENISRPAVSQHLAVLREAQLLTVHKEGRRQVYTLNPEPLRDVWENWLSRYELLWERKLADLKRVVEAEMKSPNS
jgi:DNA-binding transcriptional ArsR family regulator